MNGPDLPSTRWEAFWFTPASPLSAALVRLIVLSVGVLALIQDRGGLGLVVGETGGLWTPVGFYRMLPEPADWVATVGAPVAIVLGAATAVGWGGRAVGLPTGLLMAYLVGVANNLGKVNHDRNVLVMALIIMAFARPAPWRRQPPDWRWRWPTTAVQTAFALMLFFAAVSKFRDSGLEWVASENLRNILISENLLLRDTTLPRVALWVADSPVRWMAAAAMVVLGEALLLFGLVAKRPLIRIGTTALAFGLIIGLNLLLALGGWILMIMLLTLPDWDAVLRLAATRPGRVTAAILVLGLALGVAAAFQRPGRISWPQAGLTIGIVVIATLTARRVQQDGQPLPPVQPVPPSPGEETADSRAGR